MNTLDVLLISAPSPTPAMFYAAQRQGAPPLGLGYIATCLKQADYSVKIIDMFLPDVTVETVMEVFNNNKIHMVGLSCTTETYNVAVRIAKIVNQAYPNCIIVFGGPHVSFEYRSALENIEIDYIVINEGERSFKNLCDYCIRGIGVLDDLKGIAYKRDGVVLCAEPEQFITDLDELPFPDRTLFDNLMDYKQPSTISTSRGCPGKCIFCAASVLSGGKYRLRSAKSIVTEFEYLKSLGFNHVDIIDDTMTASVTRLQSFLDLLIERNLQMTWYCESRVDSMSRDLLEKMKSAGLRYIQFGVESGSQKILDSIKKNITLDQIYNVFRWCKELDIQTATCIIIGQPSDDESTVKDTIRLGEELIELGSKVVLTVCTPFPGTPLWNNPEEFGIEIVEHNLDRYNTFCPVFNTQYFSAGEIRNLFYNAHKTIGGKQVTSRIPVSHTTEVSKEGSSCDTIV